MYTINKAVINNRKIKINGEKLGMISIAILLITSLVLAKTFEKIDTELDIKLRTKDIIIISILSLVIGILITLIYNSTYELIHISVLIGYLMFMSYTDQKTRLLYSSVSIAMMIIEFILLVININNIEINRYTWTIVLVPLVLYIVSLFRGIGLGDVFIYTVLSLYYLQTRMVPTMSMILNILFTNIMFVVVSLIMRVISKNKDKHQPLTIYITISTVICNILFI